MTVSKGELLKRIVINPDIMLGKPTIKGTRLTVEHILGLLAQGRPIQEILEQYPRLSQEDVLACILFAQQMLAHTTVLPNVSENFLKK